MRVVCPVGQKKTMLAKRKTCAATHDCEELMDATKKDKQRRGEITAECDEESSHRKMMGAEYCATYSGETKRSVEAVRKKRARRHTGWNHCPS